MMKNIQAFLKHEEGAETLEYVVIVAVIIALAGAAYNLNFAAGMQTAFDALNAADVAPVVP